MAYHETEGGVFYAVQDWMRGLSGEEDIRYLLGNFKRTGIGRQMSFSKQRLPYTAADGKTYQREYTNDKG